MNVEVSHKGQGPGVKNLPVDCNSDTLPIAPPCATAPLISLAKDASESAVTKDIMVIDTGLLLATDAGDVISTEFHLARWFKVVVEWTFLTLTM